MRNSLIFIGLLFFASCEMDSFLNDILSPDHINSTGTLKLNSFQNIIRTNGNGYLIAGEYDLKTTLIRTDANFNTIWRNDNYGWGLNKPGGGWGGGDSYGINVNYMIQDHHDNFICSCTIFRQTGCIGSFSFLIALIDEDGKNVLNRGFNDYVQTIISIPGGGYLFKGDKLFKVDEGFNTIWEKNLSTRDIFTIKIIRTTDGNYALTARKVYESYLIITDPDGNILKSFRYAFNEPPREEIGFGLIQLPDKGFMIAGRTRNNEPFDMDYGITRINSSGEKIWSKKFGSQGEEWLENFIYSSGEEFIIQGKVGHPNDAIQKTFLLKMDINGNIADSCSIKKIESILFNPSGYFVMARKVDSTELKLSKIPFDELFNQ
jgi:hypothetical protein